MKQRELTLAQATSIVKRAFFENANRIYKLELQPHVI